MWLGSAIRHLATSRSGKWVAAAEFERRVSIWDLDSGLKVNEFDTTLDFGGDRLAIDSHDQRLVAAAYQRHGIAAYDPTDGRELWRRKDLKKAQHVVIGSDNATAYCFFDNRAAQVLDMNTGETTRTIRGTRWIVESPYEDCLLMDRTPPRLQRTDGETIRPIERATFALLDAAFAREALITTESGGPVRLFRTRDGQELWRTSPETNTHCIRLGHHEDADQLMGVLMSVATHAPWLLVHFDRANGRAQVIREFGEIWEAKFCRRGTSLVASDGGVYDTLTGRCALRFDFPTTEYPDPGRSPNNRRKEIEHGPTPPRLR